MSGRVLVAFVGGEVLCRGGEQEVAQACREAAGTSHRIAVFDDESGRPIDLNLAAQPEEAKRAPGRPKLGVVSREISLLPRHWEWLAEQPGGASGALRRLVDIARKDTSGKLAQRRAIDAAHRFVWDIAGDLPGFEEATRALFKADFAGLERQVQGWPAGIREQLARYVRRAAQADA